MAHAPLFCFSFQVFFALFEVATILISDKNERRVINLEILKILLNVGIKKDMIEKTGKNRQTRPFAKSVYLCPTKSKYIEWFGTDSYIEPTHCTRLQENVMFYGMFRVYTKGLCGTLIKNTNSNKT